MNDRLRVVRPKENVVDAARSVKLIEEKKQVGIISVRKSPHVQWRRKQSTPILRKIGCTVIM